MTITLSSTGKIVVPGSSGGHSGVEKVLPTIAPAGLHYRNVLHNGDFRVNQRAGSTYTSNVMNMDRWYNSTNGTGTKTISRVTTNQFPGVYYRRTMTSAGTYSNTTSYEWVCVQAIEGQNLIRLGLGGNSWNKVTVSAWVRASSTGNAGFLLGVVNSAGTPYYAYQMFTINTANKWEYKTATFNVSAASGCPEPLYDTSFRMQLFVMAACNTGYQGGTAGTWTTSNFFCNNTMTNFAASNGATFDVARVQLEPGDIATPYEFLPFAIELQRCQRYFQKSYQYSQILGAGGSPGGPPGGTWTTRVDSGGIPYLCYFTVYYRGGPMRVAPTFTPYAFVSGSTNSLSIDQGSWVDRAYSGLAVNNNNARIAINSTNYGYSYETCRGAWFHWSANADVV